MDANKEFQMMTVQKGDGGGTFESSNMINKEADEWNNNTRGKEEDLEAPNRELWTSKFDFLLSVIGYAVGLGNVWRFPYLCYKNGGGAFLVPYFIALICGGVPIFFLEIALGQYMSQGGLGAWNICPVFQGIGIATTVISFLLNIYYVVVLAWAVYYCFLSFTTVLPWSHCDNTWNTDRCRISFGSSNCSQFITDQNSSQLYVNESQAVSLRGAELTNYTRCISNLSFVDPVVEFWERKVLKISDGIDEPGRIVWELALSLLLVWVACYFCVWKGVKWTGKVVYFTAPFPYVILTILLIHGVTLDGALDGIIFYLKPDFSKLATSQIWIDAGTQIFFSYAIAAGCLTALGSYNKFKNNCYRDCIIISCINSSTSLYAGFAIFSVLGFMAKEQGVDISQVAESGPGLAFIAYPKAVTQMYGSPIWAVLFFFMIFILGLDSQFVNVEGIVTVATDLFPSLTRGGRRELFVAGYCLISYILGLSMVTKGGMYVFQLFDYYAASGMVLLWVCFFECIAIAWIYGVDRFYDNIEQMVGARINPWLRICWSWISPALTSGIFIFMWAMFKPLTYNRTYEYPLWAQSFGICLALASMICVPVGVVYKMLTAGRGTLKQRWKIITTPILMPQRIPTHWPDSLELKKIGRASANHH